MRHIFKSYKSYDRFCDVKGALNKPSFRRLFFSIRFSGIMSACTALGGTVKKGVHHRLHTYRYLSYTESASFQHRIYRAALIDTGYSLEVSGSVPSFLSCSDRKEGHNGGF